MLRASPFASLAGANGESPIVGMAIPDDAAVVRLPGASEGSPALVLTTDFFTPIVDDPRLFGKIAATNAMSDVYAMGGVPRFALNLAAFPTRTLPLSILAEILAGGAEACAGEQTWVVGGHTIDDPEPKFGLAVIGTVDPTKVWQKRGARPGDVLVLTKALGTGILATAYKRDAIAADHPAFVAATTSMSTSNRRAADAARPLDVHAATDVTGYGLLGHLLEMLGGLDVDAVLDAAAPAFLPHVRALALAGNVPGGSTANLEFVGPRCTFEDEVDATSRLLLADAQTSGGLLIALSPADAERYLRAYGEPARVIGNIAAGSGRVSIRG